ncbi:unnamed protein product [Polarella glacialis]|uniref:Uncharacterized protein n=1 Tax=Polarella glacialis TaxID=89957 RepID=A0A813FMV0_POLGL|nr:unnamed protein product [Polarella glacialis]CAE8676813.1 unnamed protein product [Polarella glacialis]
MKMFVDVGGDRTTADVLQVLAALEAACSSPALVVIKARALAAAAAPSCDEIGSLLDSTPWWQESATPKEKGSVKQMKKKLARARKAKWDAADAEAWKAFESYRAKWEGTQEEYDRLKEEAQILKRETPEAWGEALRDLIAGKSALE